MTKTKLCTKCKLIKHITNFSKDKTHTDGLRSYCKDCCSEKDALWRKHNKKIIIKNRENYRKNYPWRKVFSDIKQRCNNPKDSSFKNYGGRGIKCLLEVADIKLLWFRDKAYLLKQASIDRKENDRDYELDNCQFIEKSENSKKDKYKIINQYDLKGKFIKTWPSLKEAAINTNTQQGKISKCITSERKTTGGFIWRLKK